MYLDAYIHAYIYIYIYIYVYACIYICICRPVNKGGVDQGKSPPLGGVMDGPLGTSSAWARALVGP